MRIQSLVSVIEFIRMMLDHIGEGDAADHVQKAVKNVLAAGKIRTKDMGGSNTTSEIGDAITAEFLAV